MPNAKRSSAGKPPHARINFDDRIDAAAAARKAALEKFLARRDDPAFQQKQAELKAIADARAARIAERKAAKEAEAARAAAELAAKQREEQRLAAEARAAQEEERKAARDARYAARKARKQ
jgi:uncharacterized protein DUF6481